MPSGGSRCKRIWYYHTIWGNGFTPPQYDLQAKPLAASGWKMVWIKSPWDLICSLYSEQWNKNTESYIESIYVFLTRVDLKSRKYLLFLQTQRDFALKSLEIHKGFLRLFALHPACVCEISVIFFVFRYTLNTSAFMPHPLPNFMRIPNPVRVLDTRKFSEQNFWGQASCTLPCVAVYLSVRF